MTGSRTVRLGLRENRAQFALLIATLVIHRLANRQWQGALGLLEGARAQLAGRR